MGWGWTARSALLKMHEKFSDLISPDDLRLLRSQLDGWSKRDLEDWLNERRAAGLQIVADGVPALKRRVRNLDRSEAVALFYLASAWSAKAVVLFELLERSAIAPSDPAKWAGPSGLRLVTEYETDENWLWSLPEAPPWYASAVVTVE